MFSNTEVIQKTFRAFVRAQGLFRNVMKPYFQQFGISGAQWGILSILYDHKNQKSSGIKLKELGKHLLVRPSSITNVVDRLERMGFVTRMNAVDDQRAKYVHLTLNGRKMVERIHKRHPAQMQIMLAGLNHSQQEKFLLLLGKFSTHLESLEKQFYGENYECDQ